MYEFYVTEGCWKWHRSFQRNPCEALQQGNTQPTAEWPTWLNQAGQMWARSDLKANIPPAGLTMLWEINASNTHSYWCSLQHCLELHILCTLSVFNDLSLTSSLWVTLDSSITCPTKAKPQAANCLPVKIILKQVRRVATAVLSE